MTPLRFIVRNALRNKRRTALTVLSTGFSLFLLIALTTFLDILTNPPGTDQSALRLAVRRSTSMADQMPLAYLDKIRRVPHVEVAIPLQWFNGVYRDPKNQFANFATDPIDTWRVFPELEVSEETKRRFATERTAAVVGDALMERFGWKVGDHVTLAGTIFPVDLEFTIVGTYTFDLNKFNFYFRYDYLNEALGRPNTLGAVWIKADRAESIPGIAQAVDGMFRNSSAETLTETEKAFVLGFISMLGNVRLMIGSVALVVIFTMLLVSASTMAMTIRERIREVAILKAIGFPGRTVVGLILGEAVLLGLMGFVAGSAMSYGLSRLDLYALTQGFIPFFRPPLQIYAMGLGVGVAIGLASGIVPALQTARLTITEAMRSLE
jgi:putative ABC transport system permease protein